MSALYEIRLINSVFVIPNLRGIRSMGYGSLTAYGMTCDSFQPDCVLLVSPARQVKATATSHCAAEQARPHSCKVRQRALFKRGITSRANSSMPAVSGKSTTRTMRYSTPRSRNGCSWSATCSGVPMIGWLS